MELISVPLVEVSEDCQVLGIGSPFLVRIDMLAFFGLAEELETIIAIGLRYGI